MKNLYAVVATLLLPLQAVAVNINAPGARFSLTTNKVIVISGDIDESMVTSVEMQQMASARLAGPRVVLIDSNGGSLSSGDKIITMLRRESATGVQIVCVIVNNAHSMAFNIATQGCDVRLATPGSSAVVHKAAFGPGACEGPQRCTAKNLREGAAEMEKADEKNSRTNAAAMHLDRPTYDFYADQEKRWEAVELIARGYIAGFAFITP